MLKPEDVELLRECMLPGETLNQCITRRRKENAERKARLAENIKIHDALAFHNDRLEVLRGQYGDIPEGELIARWTADRAAAGLTTTAADFKELV